MNTELNDELNYWLKFKNYTLDYKYRIHNSTTGDKILINYTLFNNNNISIRYGIMVVVLVLNNELNQYIRNKLNEKLFSKYRYSDHYYKFCNDKIVDK